MSPRARRLIEEFLTLPEDEQAEVLEAIVPVDDSEFAPAYQAELEARVQAVNDGSATLLDGDDVMTRLRAEHALR
jgi:hypothetical protein